MHSSWHGLYKFDPKHTSKLCEIYLNTKKRDQGVPAKLGGLTTDLWSPCQLQYLLLLKQESFRDNMSHQI